jgi:hypothetical protein
LGVAVAAGMSGTAMAQDADNGAFALEKMIVKAQFRGFKSDWNADFMTAGPHYFAYDPESVDSYELGMKSTKLLRI